MFSENQVIAENNELHIRGRKSDITSFYLYLVTEAKSIRPSLSSMAPSVIPFALLIFFAVCLIASFVATYRYKQFYAVVTKLEESNIQIPENTQKTGKSNYLTSAVTSIIERQQDLQSMLQVVSQDVMTRTLRQLLHGGVVNYENITSTLSAIKSTFKPNAIYVVAVLDYDRYATTEDDHTSKIHHIFSASLSRFQSAHEEVHAELLPFESDLLVLVIQFDSTDLSTANAEHAVHTLRI